MERFQSSFVAILAFLASSPATKSFFALFASRNTAFVDRIRVSDHPTIKIVQPAPTSPQAEKPVEVNEPEKKSQTEQSSEENGQSTK
jgi:hypothetical protein